MYNSHNSVQSKATFASTVLAQAKLLGISIPSMEPNSPDIQAVSSAVAEKIALQTNPNISDVPTFHTPTISLPKVTAEMRATLSRLSAEACKRALLSEESRNILKKANEYGIGYIHGIQYTNAWDSFVDRVYQWEDLLEESDELHVEWADNNYDPQGLSQAIEVEKNEMQKEYQTMRSEYFAARALGV